MNLTEFYGIIAQVQQLNNAHEIFDNALIANLPVQDKQLCEIADKINTLVTEAHAYIGDRATELSAVCNRLHDDLKRG